MPLGNIEELTETLEFLSSVDNYNHWMANNLDPYVGQKVLELGCGIANVLKYFVMRKKVMGIDLDDAFVNYCRELFKDHRNCEFHKGDIFKDSFDFSFTPDTVMCLNVLEHIEDDRGALRWMAETVSDSGRLVLLVPAHQHIFGSLDEKVGHYRRYGRAELLGKVSSSGWVVRKSYYFNFIGYFGWWWNSHIRRKKDIPVKSAMFYDKHVVHLQQWLEGWVRPPFGQSLVVIADKAQTLPPASQPSDETSERES